MPDEPSSQELILPEVLSNEMTLDPPSSPESSFINSLLQTRSAITSEMNCNSDGHDPVLLNKHSSPHNSCCKESTKLDKVHNTVLFTHL